MTLPVDLAHAQADAARDAARDAKLSQLNETLDLLRGERARRMLALLADRDVDDPEVRLIALAVALADGPTTQEVATLAGFGAEPNYVASVLDCLELTGLVELDRARQLWRVK